MNAKTVVQKVGANEVTTTDLVKAANVSRHVARHTLEDLAEAGACEKTKAGQKVVYTFPADEPAPAPVPELEPAPVVKDLSPAAAAVMGVLRPTKAISSAKVVQRLALAGAEIDPAAVPDAIGELVAAGKANMPYSRSTRVKLLVA